MRVIESTLIPPKYLLSMSFPLFLTHFLNCFFFRMDAPECIPLVMEPESRFYTDPVIVLDFQSLYPSMMIAYNYCFSTCLGKVSRLDKYVSLTEPIVLKYLQNELYHNSHFRIGNFDFGCTSLNIPPALLEVCTMLLGFNEFVHVFVKEN